MKNGHFLTICEDYIYVEAKLSKMADFEIEIDKIRNTAEIFSFMAKFVFLRALAIALP